MGLFTIAPKALCILRLSAIGDVCHVVALVQAIQRQWPSTHIVWIMGKVEASLLSDLPGVDIIVFDKKQGWRSYWQVWQQLRAYQFDALLQVQAALRASLISLGIKAPYKLGFDKQRASEGQQFFTNVQVPSPVLPHVVDGLMEFASSLGVTDVTPRWNVPLSTAEVAWAKTIIQDKPTLLIVPGSSKAYKNWTVAGYVALAEHAHKQGFQVLLCGSSSQTEYELAKQITQKCRCEVVNQVGQTSLKQLLALIAQAKIMVAPDSGPVHMATLVATPVIGLYAHHNPQRVGPYLGRDNVVSIYELLVEAAHGKTLKELPWRTRVKDKLAMRYIAIPAVLDKFDQVCQHYHLYPSR